VAERKSNKKGTKLKTVKKTELSNAYKIGQKEIEEKMTAMKTLKTELTIAYKTG
jgi:hypothetical protein